jgi:hypothetical protein
LLWSNDYRSNTVFTQWDAAYFEWKLFDSENTERLYKVAAYDGERLVGFAAAEEFDFKTRFGT